VASLEDVMGLVVCADRVDQRRAWWLLRATQDAAQPVIPREWFVARGDDPQEATLAHELYASRVKFQMAAAGLGGTHVP
jgi:hypothetical protein